MPSKGLSLLPDYCRDELGRQGFVSTTTSQEELLAMHACRAHRCLLNSGLRKSF